MEPTTPTPGQPLPAAPELPKKGKGRRLAIIVILVLLIGAVAGYLIMSRGSSADDSSTARVVITASSLNPGTIHIKKGQGVTWVNQDAQTHQIASDP